jgi:hypothetical protein
VVYEYGPPPIVRPEPKRNWYARRGWWAIGAVIVVVAAVVGAVALAGSSTGNAGLNSKRGATQNAVGSGYLAKESEAIVFIQWNQSGKNLSGSAQVEALSGDPPNQSVSTDTISVSGQINGSTITLSFNDGAKVFGTLSGGTFTVNFPQRDGSLAPVRFTAATASQFNNALTALQGNTGSANESAAAAQAVASEEQSIDKAAQAVEGDISGLSVTQNLSSDLGEFSADLAQARTDLGTVAQDEQTVITESHNGTDPDQVCSDSDTVQSDADTVGSDGDAVSSTADSVEGDISSLRDDITGLQQDFVTLQRAQSQQPSYNDGAPSQAAVNQAVAAADAAIKSALNTANGDIGQANSYETQAYNDAVAAAQAGSCARPATQEMQPAIS